MVYYYLCNIHSIHNSTFISNKKFLLHNKIINRKYKLGIDYIYVTSESWKTYKHLGYDIEIPREYHDGVVDEYPSVVTFSLHKDNVVIRKKLICNRNKTIDEIVRVLYSVEKYTVKINKQKTKEYKDKEKNKEYKDKNNDDEKNNYDDEKNKNKNFEKNYYDDEKNQCENIDEKNSRENISLDDNTNDRENENVINPDILDNSSIEIDANDTFSNYDEILYLDIYCLQICGLINLGNTCFMNSALQCLYNLDTFRTHLLMYSGDHPLTLALRCLFVNMGLYKFFCPKQFRNTFGYRNKQFMDYQQHDAEEFLRALLNCIDDELKKDTKDGNKDVRENVHSECMKEINTKECNKKCTKEDDAKTNIGNEGSKSTDQCINNNHTIDKCINNKHTFDKCLNNNYTCDKCINNNYTIKDNTNDFLNNNSISTNEHSNSIDNKDTKLKLKHSISIDSGYNSDDQDSDIQPNFTTDKRCGMPMLHHSNDSTESLNANLSETVTSEDSLTKFESTLIENPQITNHSIEKNNREKDKREKDKRDNNTMHNHLEDHNYSLEHNNSKIHTNNTHTNNSTIIDDLFRGLTSSTQTCLSCKSENTITDPFLFLSLPIPTDKVMHKNIYLISNSNIQKLDVIRNYTVRNLKYKLKEMGVKDVIIITTKNDKRKILSDTKNINDYNNVFCYEYNNTYNYFWLVLRKKNVLPFFDTYFFYHLLIKIDDHQSILKFINSNLNFFNVSMDVFDTKEFIEIVDNMRKTYEINNERQLVSENVYDLHPEHKFYNSILEYTMIINKHDSLFKTTYKQLQNKHHISLEDCFELYFSKEYLVNDDKYYCSLCKKSREHSKSLQLIKLPKFLILHLSRFSFIKSRVDKINEYVDFPIVLEKKVLQKYLRKQKDYKNTNANKNTNDEKFNENTNTSEKNSYENDYDNSKNEKYDYDNSKNENNLNNVENIDGSKFNQNIKDNSSIFDIQNDYELVSVSNHLNLSYSSGHYTAYVFRNNKWFCCNDSVVNEIENINKENAYILFYRAIDKET